MQVLDYLPPYYKMSAVFGALATALDNEIERNNDAINDLQTQLFVDTATWGLVYWEQEFGIYTDLAKPYSERREQIKAKMRGSGTCTIEMIKNTALAYTNAECDVTENTSNYTFEIKFTSIRGIPPNIEDFQSTIDLIKPAHLSYTLSYTYTTWAEVAGITWDAVAGGTWDELMTRTVI